MSLNVGKLGLSGYGELHRHEYAKILAGGRACNRAAPTAGREESARRRGPPVKLPLSSGAHHGSPVVSAG